MACTGVIAAAAALALALFAGITGEPDKGLLIAEAVAVWGFGASWLMRCRPRTVGTKLTQT
jgi:hypothetical protein